MREKDIPVVDSFLLKIGRKYLNKDNLGLIKSLVLLIISACALYYLIGLVQALKSFC